MIITVRFFATYRQVIGQSSLDFEVAETATVAEVIKQLESQYSQFEGKLSAHTLIAVNETYTDRQAILQPHDTLALFPPVSGG